MSSTAAPGGRALFDTANAVPPGARMATGGLGRLAEMPDREFLIWLGGFFDGEGCICGTLRCPPPGVSRRHVGFSFLVQLGLSQLTRYVDVLEHIRDRLGFGYVEPADHNNSRYGTKNHLEVRRFLDTVSPYLIIKASRLPSMYRMLDIKAEMMRYRGRTPGGGSLRTPRALLEEAATLCATVNARLDGTRKNGHPLEYMLEAIRRVRPS